MVDQIFASEFERRALRVGVQLCSGCGQSPLPSELSLAATKQSLGLATTDVRLSAK